MEIHPGGLTPRYAVKISKRARKGLSALTGNRRTEAERFLDQIAPLTPKTRVPGKTKKLRGRYEREGVLQYDLPDGFRI